jgi:hypothetical protein
VLTMGATGSGPGLEASAPADEYEEVTFSVLSNFEYELPDPLDPAAKPDLSQVPSHVKALNGRNVSIRGFMLPLDLDQTGVSQFMLNGSLDMCYFGAPVRMNEWVLVRTQGEKKARFAHFPIVVSGRLEVGEELKNGRVVSLTDVAFAYPEGAEH